MLFVNEFNITVYKCTLLSERFIQLSSSCYVIYILCGKNVALSFVVQKSIRIFTVKPVLVVNFIKQPTVFKD